MSTLLQASLDSLPVELLHYILNYLDTQAIFLSLHKVCKRLRTIIETYDRYQLNFCLISKSNFHSVSRFIQCEHVISLTISDGYATRGQMQCFFQLFNLNRFTRLRCLNLLEIHRNDINEIFQSQTIYFLYSLKIQFRERFCLEHGASVNLASLIAKSNLKKIDLNLWSCSVTTVSWPNASILEYLKVHTCSLHGYITILQKTPRLHTFVLSDLDCLARNGCSSDSTVFETFQHLKSLTLENSHRYMNQLVYILSFTPSLVHLKIISDTNLLDGYRWEQYIQRNLPLLRKLEFFFLFYPSNPLDDTDVELLIKPYQTPFWLQTKQWFVTCEYIQNLMEIRLYTNPICKAEYTYHFHSNKIVRSTAMENTLMDYVSTMRLNWSKMMKDETEELDNFSDDRLFCKLTNLTLDIDHYWPFNSLQILSKLMNLSYLQELTLNVTFDDDFISNAVENITTLLEQTQNVHSLTISSFLIDKDDYDTGMKIFCSMIPQHVKYLHIKLLKYDNERMINDMKIILTHLEHLWSITFQFDPFHSMQSDDLIQWLQKRREDFTYLQYGHCSHIWLGKSRQNLLKITANHHSNS